MLISQIKSRIVSIYNYCIALLPVRLANQLIWIDRQSNWSISIYEGSNFLDLQPTTAVANPVLTRSDVSDVIAAFVADPFLIKIADDWLMFFEVFNHNRFPGQQVGSKSLPIAVREASRREGRAKPSDRSVSRKIVLKPTGIMLAQLRSI